MNEHKKINELLVEYTLGELPKEQTSAVQEHLEKCSECSSEIKRLEALLEHTEHIRKSSVDNQTCESAKQAILRTVEQEQTKQQTSRFDIYPEIIWRTIMNSRTIKFAAAAAIIILVFIVFHQFTSSSIVWADVLEKLGNDIKSTNNIHILFTIRMATPQHNHGEPIDSRIIKGEYWIQRNPLRGKAVLEGEQTNYFTEDKFVGLDHQDKQWFETIIKKESERQTLLGQFDALVTGDFSSYYNLAGFKISTGQVVGNEIIGDEKATIYQFTCTPSEDMKKESKLPIQLKCWIRNSDHKTVRMAHGSPDKLVTTYDLIEYDVKIPSDTFTVQIPEGYIKMLTPEERMKINVPANIILLKEAYYKARKDLPDYRMIVTNEEGYVKYQIARQGKKWRRDSFQWPVLKKKGIHPDISIGFDSFWTQIKKISGKDGENRESTYMTYEDKAVLGYWLKGDLESIYLKLPNYYALSNTVDTLEQVIWPEIGNLDSPDSFVTLLPSSEKYPGCIGIRVEYIAGARRNDPVAVLVIYWVDPSKDYMCIRFEHHQRRKALWEKNMAWEPNEPIVPFDMEQRYNDDYIDGRQNSRIVEITDTAQSPQGYWYPTERLIESNILNYKGESVESPRRIEKFYIDFEGSIDSSWFEWPSELSLPIK